MEKKIVEGAMDCQTQGHRRPGYQPTKEEGKGNPLRQQHQQKQAAKGYKNRLLLKKYIKNKTGSKFLSNMQTIHLNLAGVI